MNSAVLQGTIYATTQHGIQRLNRHHHPQQSSSSGPQSQPSQNPHRRLVDAMRSRSRKHLLPTYRALPPLVETSAGTSAASPSASADGTRKTTAVMQHDEMLSLSVGGHPFLLRRATVALRGCGRLYALAECLSPAEVVARGIADAVLYATPEKNGSEGDDDDDDGDDDTGSTSLDDVMNNDPPSRRPQFYFERSPTLFHAIFQFYVTGHIHQPSGGICAEELADELEYWGCSEEKALATCCCSSSSSDGPEHMIGIALQQQQQQQQQQESGDFDDVASSFFSSGGGAALRRTRSGRRMSRRQFDGLPLPDIRYRCWRLLEQPTRYASCDSWENMCSSVYAQIFAGLSILFVLISISGLVLGSIPELQVDIHHSVTSYRNATGRMVQHFIVEREPHPILVHLENVCIVWFMLEYFGKLAVSPHRKRTALELLNMIDLFAILPFLIECVLWLIGIRTEQIRDLKGALLVIRILRVLRVVRVLKLGRYSSGLQMFGRTLRASFRQLSMMVMVVLTGVIFFSTLVYFLEKDEPGTGFHSIPAACWWCVVTFSTVGYGDLTPVTVMGKLVATGAIACGVLVLALPITIIVDNFMKVAESERSLDQQLSRRQSRRSSRWGRFRASTAFDALQRQQSADLNTSLSNIVPPPNNTAVNSAMQGIVDERMAMLTTIREPPHAPHAIITRAKSVPA